jgi:hypothetical protein
MKTRCRIHAAAEQSFPAFPLRREDGFLPRNGDRNGGIAGGVIRATAVTCADGMTPVRQRGCGYCR